MKNGAIVDGQGKMDNFAIEPLMYVAEDTQLGFTPTAEMLNGRFAMLGLMALLGLEACTGHGIIGFLASL